MCVSVWCLLASSIFPSFTHLENTKPGFVYKYDVSLAASDFENFIDDVNVLLEEISQASSLDHDLRCVNWGHIIGKACPKSKHPRLACFDFRFLTMDHGC